MTESGILKRLETETVVAVHLTAHDARLFMNDPIVNRIASTLALAIREYGVPKIAAAFRAALILYAREENERH